TPMFSPAELDGLQQLSDEQSQPGTLSGSVQDDSIRRSRVLWLHPSDGYQWLFDRLLGVVRALNQEHYHFDIHDFDGGIQLARYDESDAGFYTWHMDAGERTATRKISISVQVSDPGAYEGGNLELFYKMRPFIADRTRGAVVSFPSWVMHRVTPVTRGVRYSLVGWVAGPRWR
ncbi:MAG: 2OG-Fe(II) oxygenase, partial [Planctomycetota bacterium]